MDEGKVKIGCRQVNGLMLQLWREGFDDGTGMKTRIKDGPGIRLNGVNAIGAGAGNTEPSDHGITEVDAAWWSKFEAQNAGHNAMLDTGLIFKIDDPPPQEGRDIPRSIPRNPTP